MILEKKPVLDVQVWCPLTTLTTSRICAIWISLLCVRTSLVILPCTLLPGVEGLGLLEFWWGLVSSIFLELHFTNPISDLFFPQDVTQRLRTMTARHPMPSRRPLRPPLSSRSSVRALFCFVFEAPPCHLSLFLFLVGTVDADADPDSD